MWNSVSFLGPVLRRLYEVWGRDLERRPVRWEGFGAHPGARCWGVC